MGYADNIHVQHADWGGTTIDFISNTPNIYYASRPMWLAASNAVISNSNGNLLFYTNGFYIANSTNDTMLNGTGLNPSSYTSRDGPEGLNIPQADLIIPYPGDSSKYYLFHVTADDSATIIPIYLYYSVIDMALDGGLGAVVLKNNILLHSAFNFGCLTSCKHANGRDWWLITHENTSDCYVKFLITPSGISGPYYQCIGKYVDLWGNNWGSGVAGGGQVVFSPDGNKFAYYDVEGDLDLMDFDRCTGNFSNLIHVDIDDSAAVGGTAFSPNSSKLYVSSERYIYQFNLDSTNVPSTQLTVAVWDSFAHPIPIVSVTFYLSQLAPDGKIYVVAPNSSKFLHVINNPDNAGLSCNVCQHCVQLPTYNFLTVPNYPNYFLRADTTSTVCDTLTSIQKPSIKFSDINLFPNPTIGVLYVVLKGMKYREAKVFNLIGQEIQLNISVIKNGEYLELNTNSLSPGIYFLELLSDKEKVVKKFVKE